MNKIAYYQQLNNKINVRRLPFMMQPEDLSRRLLREKFNHCWDILQRSRRGAAVPPRPPGPGSGTV